MATNPPVPEQNNASAKSSSQPTWILETQVPGPDGKLIKQASNVTLGQNQAITAKSGTQYKLIPAVTPVRDQNTQVSPAGTVSHTKKGLDLQLMLPGGGSLVLMGFYAAHPKAETTKLQVTQIDGSEELVLSAIPKEAPATAVASGQEGESKASASAASSVVEPLAADQASLKAVKDGGKSKSKGKKITDDDSSWLGGFDGGWLGLLALGGLGGGGGGGGVSSGGTGTGGSGTVTSLVSYTVFGNIYAGPLVSNPGGDYVVEAFNAAGNVVGSEAVNADGSYSMTMSLSNGETSLTLKVHDKNLNNSDSPTYRDEATAELKTASTMMAVFNLTSSRIKVNITGLTTLAALQSGAQIDAPVTPSMQSISAANKLIGEKFLLGEDFLTTDPVLTINQDGSANLAPNEYGLVLSRLSWLEQSSGMDPLSVINKLRAHFDSLTGNFSATVQAELDQAKALVDQTAVALAGDITAPTLTISGSVNGIAKGPVLFTLDFSEPVRNFNLSKLSHTGGTASSFQQVGANQYTVVVTPNANSTADIVLTVAQGSVLGLAGNALASTVSVTQYVDTSPPDAPTLALGSGVNDGASSAEASAGGGVVTVSAESGAATVVTFTDGQGNSVTKTVTGMGTAQAVSLALGDLGAGPNQLLDGTVTVSAVATDAAGNSGAISSTISFTLDTAAPTLSSTAPASSLGAAIAGTAGNSAGETLQLTITFDGNVNGLTSGTDSTIIKVAGTGVSATWGGTSGTNTRNLTYTVAPGQDGQATIDEAALKTALIAGISDAAGNAFIYTANSGNIGDIDATPLPVIDTTVPVAPTLALGTGVANGATSAEATAAGGAVSVSAETGASTVVTFSRSGGGTVSKTVTGTGAAQAVVLTSAELTTLGNGTISVSAIATDAAGNASSAATTSFTLDTVVPVLAIDTVASNDIVNAVKKAAGVTVRGTSDAQAGQSVSIIWGSNTQTAQVDSNGQWQAQFASANIPADASTSTITAQVSDQAGNPAVDATRTVRIDTTVPTIAITTPLTNGAGTAGDADAILNKNELDAIPSSGNFSVSGTTTAEAGQTVSVAFNNNTYSSTVAMGNTWSIQVPKADMSALAHGNSYSITVSVSDTAGNPATPVSNTLEVKLAPPDVPTITTLNTNDTTPVISGMAKKENPSAANTYMALEAGDTIAVTVDGQTYSLTVGATSTPTGLSYNTSTSVWSLDVTGTQTLAQGVYDVGVSVNAVGYVTPKTDISAGELVIKTAAPVVSVNTIAVDDVINIQESLGTLTISGTATDNLPGSTTQNTAAGRSLSLTLGGNTYSNIVVQSNGTWSVVVPAADVAGLTLASYSAQASYAGIYGNTGSASKSLAVDVAAPATPNAVLTQDTGMADATPVTSNGAITAPSNTEAQATLVYRVTKDGGTPSSWGASYTAPATNGTADGAYKVEVRQTDLAGNSSELQALNFVLDTQNPTAPILSLGTGVSDGATTAEATAAGGGVTVSAETGASVVVTFSRSGGGTVTKTVTGNGIAQAVVLTSSDLTTLGNGSINVSAIATDAAGNASSAGTISFTLDTVAPTVSSVLISATGASDTLLNAGDVVTVTTTYSETVNGQPTTAPTLTMGTETGIALTAGTTTGNTRTWTYTIAATSPTDTGAISVVGNMAAGLSDPAGNAVTGSTPAATGTFTADTTAPTVVITDNATGTAIGPVTFTYTFSEVVTGFDTSKVTASGGTKGTFTAVSATVYTLVVTPAANSTSPIELTTSTAGVIDSAGNPATAPANYSQAVDTVAPTVSSVLIGASGASDALLNAGDVVTVTTTYSEAVTGQHTTAPTLTIGTETGIVLTAGTTTGNTRTWTYIISSTSPTDTGSISVVGNMVAGVADAAGNAASGSTPQATGSFTADTSAPTLDLDTGGAGNNWAQAGAAQPDTAYSIEKGGTATVTEDVAIQSIQIAANTSVPVRAGEEIVIGSSTLNLNGTGVSGTVTVSGHTWTASYANNVLIFTAASGGASATAARDFIRAANYSYSAGAAPSDTRTLGWTVVDMAGNSSANAVFTATFDLLAPVVDMDGANAASLDRSISATTAAGLTNGVSLASSGTVVETNKIGNLKVLLSGINDAGQETLLVNGNSLSTSPATVSDGTNTWSVSYSGSGSSITFTFTLANASSAQAQVLLNTLKYVNSAGTPSDGARILTISATDEYTNLSSPTAQATVLVNTATPAVSSSTPVLTVDSNRDGVKGDQFTLSFGEMVDASKITLANLALSAGSYGTGATLVAINPVTVGATTYARQYQVRAGTGFSYTTGTTLTLAAANVVDVGSATAAANVVFNMTDIVAPGTVSLPASSTVSGDNYVNSTEAAAGLSSGSAVVFNFGASSDNARIRYYLNNVELSAKVANVTSSATSASLSLSAADLGADGVKALTARLEDGAGNLGKVSTPYTFTVDTVLTQEARSMGLNDSNGNSAPDAGEKVTVVFNKPVQLAAGGLPSVFGSSATAAAVGAIKGKSDTWEITLAGTGISATLGAGTSVIFKGVTDAAGNGSTATGTSTGDLTVSVPAGVMGNPTITQIASVTMDNVISNAERSVQQTVTLNLANAKNGDVVTLFMDGVSVGSATVGSDGQSTATVNMAENAWGADGNRVLSSTITRPGGGSSTSPVRHVYVSADGNHWSAGIGTNGLWLDPDSINGAVGSTVSSWTAANRSLTLDNNKASLGGTGTGTGFLLGQVNGRAVMLSTGITGGLWTAASGMTTGTQGTGWTNKTIFTTSLSTDTAFQPFEKLVFTLGTQTTTNTALTAYLWASYFVVSTTNRNLAVFNAPANSWFTNTFTVSSTTNTWNDWRDGQAVGNGSVSSIGITAHLSVGTGTKNVGVSGGFEGYMGDTIIVDQATLTIAQRLEIETYLASKYSSIGSAVRSTSTATVLGSSMAGVYDLSGSSLNTLLIDQSLDLRTLTGSTGYKVITAGTDWVATGAGPDTVYVMDLNFRFVDAGQGMDTLVLDSSYTTAGTLVLADFVSNAIGTSAVFADNTRVNAAGFHKLMGFEKIDVSQSTAAQSLTVDKADVSQLADVDAANTTDTNAHTLGVVLGANDSITATGFTSNNPAWGYYSFNGMVYDRKWSDNNGLSGNSQETLILYARGTHFSGVNPTGFGQVAGATTGADTLAGGTGNDVLQGGQGSDSLSGGLGADIFRFVKGELGTDTVIDFSKTQGDKIDLSSLLQATGFSLDSNLANYLQLSTNGAGNAVLNVDPYGESNFSSSAQTIIFANGGTSGLTTPSLMTLFDERVIVA